MPVRYKKSDTRGTRPAKELERDASPLEVVDRVTSDGTWTYTFDAEGNRIKKSKGASLETWTFGYDQRNQMTWLEQRATDGGSLLLRLDFKYDYANQRIEESRWTSATGTVTQRFGQERGQLWADLDNTNALTTRYLRPDEQDALAARSSAGGTVGWYLPNRQLSIVANLDATGALTNKIAYNSVGKVTSETNAAAGDRFKWQGKERQSDSNLMLHLNRWYDVETSTWVTRDPLGFRAGDYNLSRPMGNNVPNHTDPTGLELLAENKDTAKRYLKWMNENWKIDGISIHQAASGRWLFSYTCPSGKSA